MKSSIPMTELKDADNESDVDNTDKKESADEHSKDDGADATSPTAMDLQLSRNPMDEQQELDTILAAETKIPILKLIIIAVVWIVMLISALLKGSSRAPSLVGISCGSVAYWLVMLMPMPFILATTAYVSWTASRRYGRKEALGYAYQEGDVRWTKKRVVLYPLVCFFAGLLTAMIGIGGGMSCLPGAFALTSCKE
eukprot:TRINITY_DN11410_c0_g1_i3.p1 TRINITY_DN11410_c0_g1~~TRINITY_DN11410_c0_g1_i3.p1  ORF type:complete len:196 (-),score=36.20 TRINITY_DN11410_c0_g1_i3:12-599(-)